jgi:uncharacterized cupredoxin-like copper-binding protein
MTRKHAFQWSLRPAVLAVAIAAAALALVPLAGAATTTVNVKAGEMYFKLSTKSIAKPEMVTFDVKNAGKLMHDFRIDGKQTPLLKPGKSAKLTVKFTKKGKYAYECTVPGHAAAGMKGVFTVH